MESMLIGQVFASPSADGDTVAYEGLWGRVQGDKAVCSIESYVLTDSASFSLRVETKTSEDTDAAATILGTVAIAAVGITKTEVSQAKQFLRLVVVATGSLDATGPEFMHGRFLAPQWAFE